jgi:putative membrane protein
MKKQSKVITRCAYAALAMTGLCLTGVAFAAEPSPAPKADAKKGMPAPMDSKDRDFMMEAAKANMEEVEMGKMAEQKGQSADVKKFGQTMVTDHSKANGELMALASKKGVKLDTSHKMKENMGGANFDQEYLADMVKDHQKDIAAFESEAKNGMDPDVKSWAGKTLPTLKKHLKMAQDAQGKIKKS